MRDTVSYQAQCVLPFVFVGKKLREDVRTHVVGRADMHCKVFMLESLGKPRNADSMGSPDVSHRRVFACAHNLGASFIVLEESARQGLLGVIVLIPPRG